jgi:phospholipase C
MAMTGRPEREDRSEKILDRGRPVLVSSRAMRKRERAGGPALAVAILASALSLPRDAGAAPRCRFGPGALPSETLRARAPKGDEIPLDHILVLMQENRSFDHYFGRLPAFGHREVKGLPRRASNPDAEGRRVPAFHEERYCIEDVAHSWNASHAQFNRGRNDGFVTTNDPDGARAMGFYDWTDLPFYYALATTFAIGDRTFCSLLGPTFPNRFFLFSGTSDGRIRNAFEFYSRPSILGQLTAAGIPWKVYFSDAAFAFLLRDVVPSGLANIVPIVQYFMDAAAGTLPAVAYIDPRFTGDVLTRSDEHPPADMQVGQKFVADVVNALIASPQWPRAALILVYDEHGGYYDHVRPRRACEPDDVPPRLEEGDTEAKFDRYGFRVPLIAVSPWARPGFVSHKVYDLTSVLRFVQTRFNLPALTRRDANARPLLELFDFREPRLLAPPPLPAATIDPGRAERCMADFPSSASGAFVD